MTHRDFAFHAQTPTLDAPMGLGHRAVRAPGRPPPGPVPSAAAPRRPGGRLGEHRVEPQEAQVLGERPLWECPEVSLGPQLRRRRRHCLRRPGTPTPLGSGCGARGGDGRTFPAPPRPAVPPRTHPSVRGVRLRALFRESLTGHLPLGRRRRLELGGAGRIEPSDWAAGSFRSLARVGWSAPNFYREVAAAELAPARRYGSEEQRAAARGAGLGRRR